MTKYSILCIAKYSSTSIKRHLNEVKHVLRYLHGITNIGLFYLIESKYQLLGYVNVDYLKNPHKA